MANRTPRDFIVELARRDGRYEPEAFFFVSEAFGFTQECLRTGRHTPNDRGASREEGGGVFHVSGQELLAGIRLLARERWGPLSPLVFRAWGVRRTEDFGAIVFLMVSDQDMQWKKRECDTPEDFANGFDFADAFSAWED